MAGNTKLWGFLSPSSIVLERWGGKATVQVPVDTFQKIRHACHDELPKNPPPQHPTMLRIKYDPTFGWIEMVASPQDAEALARHLSGGDQLTDEQVKWLVERLLEAANEHRKFLNKEGEPGIE